MKWFSKIFSESADTDNTSGELNAFLGVGTRFTGNLSFEGSVRIDGHFQGTITATGTLILGRDALVKGEVDVASLNANGTFIGTVRASHHVHLHEHAVFDGHVLTPALGMDQGAVLNGSIEMPNPRPRTGEDSGEPEMPVLPTQSGRAQALGAEVAPETEDVN
ncbi:protein CcmA, bactofilin family [Humidesulfovibrio mexicanus]|uniref:Protein CcmA, bactofilin family n=1 Tax=Humidesulfovibrio mexicanus TaxID=147047 RepID=A0A239CAV0_9BACT|nr:polymer-forming cytoskeletal protein [Humidesulfovibrio mexicanus]SNS17089.1 protein CcmA, bactofilin family [Humidesulfovibrio mexicanus]